jgi:hypothetical protein
MWSTLAFGVFFGNWLMLPVFTKRNAYEAFWIGVIAALFVMLLGKLITFYNLVT